MDANELKTSTDYSDDIEVIEAYMKHYGGGEVYLSKEFWNEGIAIININNPHKRNAISGKMMSDFRNCIKELKRWKDGKTVILQGSSEYFCSGGDLSFARACHTEKDAYYFSSLMNNILDSLMRLPIISISLVNGHTLGGGAEIAVACDYMVVVDNAKVGFVHGKMGIITAWGGTTRLCNKIGRHKALDLLLTAKILNARECLDIGLADHMINSEDRLRECVGWIRRRMQHHISVIRAFKEASLLHMNITKELIEKERDIFVPLWGGAANKEALSKNIKHIPNKI